MKPTDSLRTAFAPQGRLRAAINLGNPILWPTAIRRDCALGEMAKHSSFIGPLGLESTAQCSCIALKNALNRPVQAMAIPLLSQKYYSTDSCQRFMDNGCRPIFLQYGAVQPEGAKAKERPLHGLTSPRTVHWQPIRWTSPGDTK